MKRPNQKTQGRFPCLLFFSMKDREFHDEKVEYGLKTQLAHFVFAFPFISKIK